MKKLLHIQASPRGERSASMRVANAYIDAMRANGSAGSVDTLDIWKEPLPPFDGDALEAKYAGLAGQTFSPAQTDAWKPIVALADRLKAANCIVLSVPMWNFGVPYRMKHLIDLVTQKDVTFRFDANGFDGILKDKSAVLICARGMSYSDAGGASEKDFDFQKSYLTAWLRFIGISNINTITVEKTLFGAAAETASVEAGIEQARKLADTRAHAEA
jgi:FMN-dependent NADH-azoreductase